MTDSADSAFHHENLLGMKVGWGDNWLKQLVWAPIEEQCSSVILVIVSKVLLNRKYRITEDNFTQHNAQTQ